MYYKHAKSGTQFLFFELGNNIERDEREEKLDLQKNFYPIRRISIKDSPILISEKQ